MNNWVFQDQIPTGQHVNVPSVFLFFYRMVLSTCGKLEGHLWRRGRRRLTSKQRAGGQTTIPAVGSDTEAHVAPISDQRMIVDFGEDVFLFSDTSHVVKFILLPLFDPYYAMDALKIIKL